jgi:hypothetical protein
LLDQKLYHRHWLASKQYGEENVFQIQTYHVVDFQILLPKIIMLLAICLQDNFDFYYLLIVSFYWQITVRIQWSN